VIPIKRDGAAANASRLIGRHADLAWLSSRQLNVYIELMYFMPIMGLIFLRHATNHYYEVKAAIDADKTAGRMPDRPLRPADFTSRRALMLPEAARYDVLLKLPKDSNLGEAVTNAMQAVEDAFTPLAGQLPKDYARFENAVLESRSRGTSRSWGRELPNCKTGNSSRI
jgi:hypothetical protein